MRDVTPKDSFQFSQLKILIADVKRFALNPLHGIANLPLYGFKELIFLQILMAMLTGFISGLIPPNIYQILFGIFFFPVISLITSMALTFFIYYYFQIFERKTEDLRKLYTLFVFANIPFFTFYPLVQILSPITLIGFAITCLLIIVGLTENFHLDKKKSMRLVSVLAIVVLIGWLLNKVSSL